MLQMGIQPEKEREGEGERERDLTQEKSVFPVTGPSFIVQERFYTFGCT